MTRLSVQCLGRTLSLTRAKPPDNFKRCSAIGRKDIFEMLGLSSWVCVRYRTKSFMRCGSMDKLLLGEWLEGFSTCRYN